MTISTERLREVLDYDQETGVFRRRKGTGGCSAGTVAGFRRKDGYVLINIDSHQYLAHRLAWMFINGDLPDNEIDHINCDPSDNRIHNLRLATRGHNMANARKTRRNTSGFKGVWYSDDGNKWRAEIAINGRKICLGRFATPEDAHSAYCAAAEEHFGEFARFG